MNAIAYEFKVIGVYLANVRMVVRLLFQLSPRNFFAAIRVLLPTIKLEDRFGIARLHAYIYLIQYWRN